MSALHPKADMVRHERDVRFVPKADIGMSAIRSQQWQRDAEPKRLGRLEIYREVKAHQQSAIKDDWRRGHAPQILSPFPR
jgi:hypothetical protein